MKMWVVGRIDEEDGWHLTGVFSSEQKALEICEEPTHFIGPIESDIRLGGKRTVEWPGAYFPLADIEGPGRDENGG